MRVLVRLVLAVGVLLALGIAALALFLPSIVRSDAVRARIESAAEEALGRDVRYAELDFGLFPPSLVVMKPRVAGATEAAEPMLEAEDVALRVALVPLLARTVVVDSLVIEGAVVRLVRTKQGIELPRGAGARGAESPAGDEAGGEPGASPLALALRGVELRDATLILEDRAVSPNVTWELRRLDARARGRSLDEPFDLDFGFELASGGSAKGRGSAGLDGRLDMELQLEGLALAPLRPYLEGGSELAGSLTGSVRVKGPAASPTQITVDATLGDGRLTLDEISLVGRVALEAELSGGLEKPAGSFELDATQAELRYGSAFTKPPGTAATLKGRIVTGADGSPGVDDLHLKMRDLDAQGRVELGRRKRILVSAPAFDLRGWEELLPALRDYELAGPMRIDALNVATDPLEIRGGVELDGVSARLPDAGRVVLRGGLVGDGAALRTRDLQLVAADQVIALEGDLRELQTRQQFRVRLDASQVQANPLVSTFSSQRDFLYGLLSLGGELSGALGAPGDWSDSLDGGLRLDVGKGRMRGVSFLQLTLSQLGGGGALAMAAARPFLGRLERFYGDEFDAITGTLRVVDGVARTDDLRIRYPSYTADLQAAVRLRDLGLDGRGTLTLGPEITALLPGGSQRSSVSVPLVAVKGTLRDPKVRPDARVLLALFQVPLTPALDLSGEGGRAVGEILDRLGGKKRK